MVRRANGGSWGRGLGDGGGEGVLKRGGRARGEVDRTNRAYLHAPPRCQIFQNTTATALYVKPMNTHRLYHVYVSNNTPCCFHT